MPTSRASSPGTKRLSEVARLVVQPDGIVSTDWRDHEVMCRRMGIEFDEWQKGVGRLALAKRKDGKLAAMIGGVGMSLPRQVGKTYLMAGLIFSLCALRPGTLVIWSAHHSKTHEETFLSMQGFADRAKVAPYVDKVYTGSGDESVVFKNGSRILFGARERGFGRGIPGVDALVFDEAQILSEKALDAILATMNVSPLGLAFYTGTPPRPDDNSESFAEMRKAAMAGELRDAVWIECSADADADSDDREQWRKANPSYPGRTPDESILRLRRKLSEESFRREALGIWDSQSVAEVIPSADWAAIGNGKAAFVGPISIGIDMSQDRTSAAVALAGETADGKWLVAMREHKTGPTDWVVPFVKSFKARNTVRAVVIDKASAAASLVDQFERERVKITTTAAADMADACGKLFDGVYSGWLVHTAQPQLAYALSQARKRDLLGGGAWGWNKKTSESDITPVVAVTLALWGARHSNVKKNPNPNPDRTPGRAAGRRVVAGRVAGRR